MRTGTHGRTGRGRTGNGQEETGNGPEVPPIIESDEIAAPKIRRITIKPPNVQVAEFLLEGTAPYVQNAFSGEQKGKMHETQAEGTQMGKKRLAKPPKDFERCYRNAQHRDAREGWFGIPASSFRNAMIDACRLVGFAMTQAKMTVFALADGRDADGTPLVKIIGEPHPHEMAVRNESGTADLRVRPMWDEWQVALRVEFNADQFTELDIANLLLHAGRSIGIGEGRPFSKKSYGLGWGTFKHAGVVVAGTA